MSTKGPVCTALKKRQHPGKSKSRSRKRRASTRRVAAAERGKEISADYLRKRGVRDSTATKYNEFLEEFDAFIWDNGLETNFPGEMDECVTHWMADQFADGIESFRGSYMLAAIAWRDPRYSRWGPWKLPFARQTLAAWKTLSPGHSRLPMPEGLVAGLAMHVCAKHSWVMAAEILMNRIFYLRPGEASRLRGRHLIPPGPGGGLAPAQWSIVLHEQESQVPSKTLEFDETLLLDLPRDAWFGAVLRRLKVGSHPDDFVFPAKSSARAAALREAGHALSVEAVPYKMRHSGASIDFSSAVRPLEGVRHRGRWRCPASVRRYEKGGRLTQAWAVLPPDVQNYCIEAVKGLPDVLIGRKAAKAFPGC